MLKNTNYWLVILYLFIIGCSTHEKKTDYFSSAEKAYLHYSFKEASLLYTKYITGASLEKDSNFFVSLCRLCECYSRNNDVAGLSKTYLKLDSLYRSNSGLKRYCFDYYYASGLNEYNKHDYSEALNYFLNAILLKPSEDTAAIYLYNKVVVCLVRLNKIKDAENYLFKGLKLAGFKKNRFSNELSSLYNLLAYINLKFKTDFYTAGLYYDSVIYVAKKCKYLDSLEFAWNLWNIGCFFDLKGASNKAISYITESYNIYNNLKLLNEDFAFILLSQANFDSYSGKFENSYNKINRAIEIFSKYNNFYGLQRSYKTKAYSFFLNQEYENALINYKIAFELNTKHNLRERETILNDIAWCYSRQNIIDSADFYYKESIKLLSKNSNDVNINTLITLYGEYSRMLISVLKYREALNMINDKAGVVSKTIGKNNSQFGYFIYWKALALDSMKRYELSLEVYQQVIGCSIDKKQFEKGYKEVPDFITSEVISFSNVIDALIGKAGILSKMALMENSKKEQIFLMKKAFEHYHKASELVDYFNKKIISENDRLNFISSERNIYELELSSAALLYRKTNDSKFLEAALNAADNSKAVQLTLDLKDEQYKIICNIPDSLLRKQNNVQEDISLYNSYLRDENSRLNPDKSKLSFLQNRLTDLLDKSENIKTLIEKEYPRYTSLRYENKILLLDSIQSELKKGRVLLEYAFVKDSLYIFVISSSKVSLISTASPEIENMIKNYSVKLKSINDSNTFKYREICDFVKIGNLLYQKLIKQAIPSDTGNELIIIPDGLLNLLPFESLVTKNYRVIPNGYDSLDYFLYDYNVSYSYSLALYSIQQKNKARNTGKLIAFAPVYKNKLFINVNDTFFLSSINSKYELEKIEEIAQGDYYYGRKASKENFKKHISDGNMIHLSMHAYVDNEQPDNSKLFFSQSKNSAENFYLNTFELYNLKIKSPLLVLNACNTGNGKMVNGEGLISIARGFTYAGCPSMVITQWDVADNSSIKLMKYFYSNLTENYRIDESLRLAKIEYIKNSDRLNSHPYFWAGFIQTGCTDAIKLNTPRSFNFISNSFLIVVSLFTALYIIIYRRRIKNKNAQI